MVNEELLQELLEVYYCEGNVSVSDMCLMAQKYLDFMIPYLQSQKTQLLETIESKEDWIKGHMEGRTESFKKGEKYGFANGVFYSALLLLKADHPKMSFLLHNHTQTIIHKTFFGMDNHDSKLLRKVVKDHCIKR